MFSNSAFVQWGPLQLKWSPMDKHRRRAHFTTFKFHYGEVVINTRRLAPWLVRSRPVPTSCQFPASVLGEEDVLLFWMCTDKREWCCLWAWLNIPLGDFPIHGRVGEIPTWSWVCWCYHCISPSLAQTEWLRRPLCWCTSTNTVSSTAVP